MQYGYFDNKKREYVIDNVALPCSWTNYLGVEDMAAVINHTAGGYLFYKTLEYHRISRFRGNGVPMDRPGFYVYIRDNEKKDYHSISWQPVAKDLSKAKYRCRHGLSYTVYESEYDGLASSQTMVIPRGENVLLWDVKMLVLPGLVDVHFHGAAGYDFCDGTQEAYRAIEAYENSHGITSICPATMTLPVEQLKQILTEVSEDKPDSLVGVHLEGPFINKAKKGAQKEEYVIPPSVGVPKEQAIRVATINPAVSIGVQTEVGSLEAGKYANIVIADKELHRRQVILKGVSL